MYRSKKASSQIHSSNPACLMLITALCLALLTVGSALDRVNITPKVEAANLFVVVPNGVTSSEGNINNAFPFNINVGTSARYQQVYAASDFSVLHEPMLLKEIRFRPDAIFGGPFNVTLHDIQINLSTTQRTPTSLSTIFGPVQLHLENREGVEGHMPSIDCDVERRHYARGELPVQVRGSRMPTVVGNQVRIMC